jgi:hypothetical protein
MVYMVDELGFRAETKMNLDLRGAIFQFKESCAADGSLFHGDNVSNISIGGGDIRGRNDVWKDGVSIRGI